MRVSIPKEAKGTVLNYLREKGIVMSAPCGGQGICGKCKVKLLEGEGAEAKGNLSVQEVSEGYRLACKLLCKGDMEVEIDIDTEQFVVIADFSGEEKSSKQKVNDYKPGDAYGVAIDIGTTTLALSLIHLQTKQTIQTYTALNSGRICGADVISRIEYSNTHGSEYLQQLMIEDIEKGIEWLCEDCGIFNTSIQKVVVAGNTTMLHLLVGASCQNLGVYPFTPEFIEEKQLQLSTLLRNDQYRGEAILLPGISTYVGADIISGIMQCNMHEADEISMLIDIGTNGEMVIGNKNSILGLATAAGPAFEGGNISCGTGSIQGAICKVKATSDKVSIETIGGKKPVGICGSGLIDLVACSIENGWIDETGMIEDEEDEINVVRQEPAIYLTQKDIRQFQLAKSAIRAGIEILAEDYGIALSQIDTVYLAGGFGKFIDLDNAITIGLLPRDFNGKIKRVGNVALGGAIHYLKHEGSDAGISTIKKISQELNLANEPKFNDYFIQYMLFEEE